MNKKTYTYPLICTRGAIIFPHQETGIDVGRSNSINTINYANENGSLVVITCQKDIKQDDVSIDNIYSVGTLCLIKNLCKRSDYYKVTFLGQSRCRIVNADLNGDIFQAEIELLEEEHGDELALKILTGRAIDEFNANPALNKLGGLSHNLLNNFDSIVASSIADGYAQNFVNDFAHKQEYLEENVIEKRLEKMIVELNKDRMIEDLEKEINEKIRKSMEASQRDYYLREKLKAIKEELGDDQGSEADKFRKMVEDNPYPDYVKKKALEEIRKFEIMPAAAGESGVTRSYIEWLLNIPWYTKSKDNEDLKKAADILDEDHYGLDKVKERILEYLAVKQMTNSLKSPILCLVGPPGVGKTSLARSVARALDRKFVKVSLGGVKDEAEIRGHRRTYLGSMPGRIIQGMKKAGTLNPVFLIDEIDKLSSDYKGDPSSAMLEVLDPEQNSMFSDHYIEEPYDLSDVLFIATANYKENIPAALYDRLEIIDISSYTEIEKLNIAREHLITKQMEANGLKKSQFILSDDMILYLIRHYTREAGVRNLERIIGTLCRKAVLDILKEGKKSVRITKKLLQTWLGRETFEYGLKENKDQVGVVTGLAYTQFGGDILPIEVNYFEGKGKFIVTGQLGDVMKESTEIALDYIKSNARKYNIDPEFFEKHDIHIHCPEGAVPKDGPSAGVTLTTALISALTKHPVKSDLAMTGEVTLRGNVLPIGGLKEKSLAAHRSGIKKIVIPKANIKDLEDVPQTVKDDVVFIPVERVDQVIKEALV